MAVWLISTPDIFYITFFIFVYIDTNAIYGKTQMIVVNIEKCGHCGACVAVCPTNSIELIESCLRIRRHVHIVCDVHNGLSGRSLNGRGRTMRDEYDVIVVGAGPGGSIAARTAAEECDVLLIEKRQEIGSPVRCAEFIREMEPVAIYTA